MFKYKDEIKQLKAEKENLMRLVKQLTEDAKSPKRVLESVMNREIKWIDWENMSKQAREDWFNSANALIKNSVFKHLFGSQDGNEWTNGMLVKTLLEVGVIEATPSTIRDIQMTINGIELCRQELDKIVDPKYYRDA
jgi:hypothetical protein